MSVRNRRRYRTRSRQQMESQVHILSDSDNEESCIDLTVPEDGSVVDLTSSTTPRSRSPLERIDGANDMSVVVIGSSGASPTPNRRPRRTPELVDIDNDDDLNTEALRPRRLRQLSDFDDDSLIELPPAPFNIQLSTPKSQPPQSSAVSPDPITCPVCLDDYKTIKKAKKKLFSTICGHVFCENCIKPTIESMRCCPVCRKKLTLRNIHSLHI